MPLHLTLENENTLPDGGPVTFTVAAQRGIDIGRDQYLDWVLPDPTRSISGKHCEIRYRDGRYWLTDVSTNGTFVNRSEFRIGGPHPLAHGDRIEIGRYIIAVAIEPDGNEAPHAAQGGAASSGQPGELWSVGEAAPAINPRELRSPVVAAGIGSHDVLDWAASLPSVEAAPAYTPQSFMPASAPPAPAPPAADAMDWAMPQPNRPLPMPEAQAFAPAAAPPPAPAAPVAFAPAATPVPPTKPSPPPARSGFSWDLDGDGGLPPIKPLVSVPAPDRQDPGDQTFRPVSDKPVVLGRSTGTQREPKVEASPFPAPAMSAPPAPPPPMEPARPAPPPLPVAQPFVPSAPVASASSDEILRRFAAGAGIPPDVLRAYDAGQLAEMLGRLMRSTVENVRQLQTARSQSKGVMRSANHTMVEATGNNPIKFTPSAEDALKIMFGPRTASYLGAQEALDQSLADVKRHQMLLFTAMQTALRTLLQDLEPEKIEASMDEGKGIGALLQSRKAKLWDRYETRWKAKVGNNEQGMLGVFMLLFAEAYDRS